MRTPDAPPRTASNCRSAGAPSLTAVLLALAAFTAPTAAQEASPPPEPAQAEAELLPAASAQAPVVGAEATDGEPFESESSETGSSEIELPDSGRLDGEVVGGGATDAELAEADTAEAEPAEAPADPRTQAERDFQSIYGGDAYDPVADPTLPAPARIGTIYDPWEPFNRRVHRFNNVLDRRVALPLARAYMRVVPRPVRLGVSNFFSNLGQPVSAVNALLQGKPRQSAEALGRFALNSTLGIGGIFDPASDAKMANRSEDFGQTLGIWGWERSRYLELPLFGPRTVRDALGLFGDAPLSPLRQVSEDSVRIPLQGLQLVDVRTQLMSTDSLRAGAEDDYALVRDAWSQRRNYQIFGDRLDEDEVGLPEYLLDDTIPIVPVGAMPVLPTGGY